MPGSELVFYRYGYGNLVTFEVYNSDDLLSFSEEFASNRSFESWADVFQKSLIRNRDVVSYKKRNKERLVRRFPKKIIRLFWEMVCNDLIKNEAEVVLKDSKYERRRLVLKMGYYENPSPKLLRRRRKYKFAYGGMLYTLRLQYPVVWPHPKILRFPTFYPKLRTLVRKELRNGRRYFNSTREKIFSRL